MSNQYAGGFISKTPPTVTTSSAQGMWTLSQQMQYQQAGSWPTYSPYGWPVPIGSAYGGGFFAGQILISGTKYNLVVAPKSTGENSSRTWGTYGVTTGFTSSFNGPANSAGEANLGSNYQAAYFCEGLSIGDYNDWYLPAKNELEVLYYFLKPTTTANDTASGSNANAVSPEPISQNYTSGSPAQTTATGVNGFRTGETNAFASSGNEYWSSTESLLYPSAAAYGQEPNNGYQAIYGDGKSNSFYVRAIRRIPTIDPPTTIGGAYGGGFYAGRFIDDQGILYNLVVASKASGENSARTWGSVGVTTGVTSAINGPANTATLNALGSAYQAAQFCAGLNAGSGLNNYTDWYLPAKNELEVLYYFLKPTITANNTASGSNANAVSPEPISQNYTSGSPARTSAGIGFRYDETNAFAPDYYWSSTAFDFDYARVQNFSYGVQSYDTNNISYYVRAVRRVPVIPDPPAAIGGAYGGGFYAGRIVSNGQLYNLVVAPKSSGEALYKLWGTYNVNTGTTSVTDGKASTATLVALGSDYQGANFCNSLNAGSGLNNYTDWYMPAKNELEVLYYNLKPTTTANDTSNGSNANAVYPEIANLKYSTTSPAQTTNSEFRTGGSQVFETTYPTNIYMSTTQYDIGGYWMQYFETYAGFQDTAPKNAYRTVRAIRKVLVS